MRSDILKITVIIPIYNIENYVKQCVHSVLSQSWGNMEIILVDDGSTDDSPRLCNELKMTDDRILVIHQKNGGLSEARNAGIRRATGEYILFLDGDDFWNDNNAIERLVQRAMQTKADVINFSYQKYSEDTGDIVPYFQNVPAMPEIWLTKEEQVAYLTRKNLYIASACNKLIRRDLFDDDLMFVPGIYSEDIEWCLRLLIKATSLDFICENFYCYRQRSDSITHTVTEKKCDDLCNNIIGCIKKVEKFEEPMKTYLYSYVAFQFATFFSVQARAKQEPIDCIRLLAQYKWILRYYGSNKKLFVLYLGCSVIGYYNLCRLIRMIRRK